MSRGEPRRVLVHAAGALGERLAGPEIRALEFAKALSAEYEVTLAARRATEGERDGIRVVPSNRRRLKTQSRMTPFGVSSSHPSLLPGK